MKQTLKQGDEYDLVSRWRKQGILHRKAGVWKRIKARLAKRRRAEGKRDARKDSGIL
jgi:hypothetical protein